MVADFGTRYDDGDQNNASGDEIGVNDSNDDEDDDDEDDGEDSEGDDSKKLSSGSDETDFDYFESTVNESLLDDYALGTRIVGRIMGYRFQRSAASAIGTYQNLLGIC